MCLTFQARLPTFDPELTWLLEGQSHHVFRRM
jgi:hypothetical protein